MGGPPIPTAALPSSAGIRAKVAPATVGHLPMIRTVAAGGPRPHEVGVSSDGQDLGRSRRHRPPRHPEHRRYGRRRPWPPARLNRHRSAAASSPAHEQLAIGHRVLDHDGIEVLKKVLQAPPKPYARAPVASPDRSGTRPHIPPPTHPSTSR
jgi:hypothetical protein